MPEKPGQLYIVATPIGNQADFSPRAISVLQKVDKIAAEDTRHSSQLLRKFNISTHCIALHEHNERQCTAALLDEIQQGKSIALISDAGTPLVSDPGYFLVRSAHQQQINVVPIPGPSAVIAALSASGLPTSSFCFEGFVPSKPTQRQRFYEGLKKQSRTLIFYEAPHRIAASLSDLARIFGAERTGVIARELTKTFETVKYDELGRLRDWVRADSNQQKGEIVIVVEGFKARESEQLAEETDALLRILLAELPLKQAVRLAAEISGEKRKKLYQYALLLKEDDNQDS